MSARTLKNLLSVATIVLAFAAALAWWQDWSGREALFAATVVCSLATLFIGWRQDRVAFAELEALSDVPNPPVEQVREYRLRHPQATLLEAVAAVKQHNKAL
ncbi:hypothetical protein [Corynebacterium aquilae]|uniref:Uncharacterized protein n=1 Tax=Corynebacterium aquilae DSM 44791 TaxID=1431546 RepID=A0A1L7CIL1_9CORY|nr:hypothetical protein [Corynebacterium aquilae]APT85613.1 hypothetical protein CAQU_11825 [Corynebacterium aquilae DSM 44791]